MQTPWERWWVGGSVAAGTDTADTDLIYAWMSPFESARAAAALSTKLGRPWVADLGDPWALDEMMVYPTRLHRRRELAEMRRLLGTASAIVMSTPEAAQRVLTAFPELADRPVVAVPNGFDGRDFDAGLPDEDWETFRIVHTGYLHTTLGLRQRRFRAVRRLLGGEAPGVDFLTRSHVYLLEAVEKVLRLNPDLASRLEVHLAGVLTPIDREIASRSPAVRLHGYLSHGQTLELIRRAGLLFLPMQNLTPGVRAGIVPGKTYEYLGSGRPVLAAVPDGDARDILTEAGNSYVCRPDDVAAMADAITAAVRAWQARERFEPPARSVVQRYEYRRLTATLAGVFDQVAASAEKSSPATGRGDVPSTLAARLRG